MTCLKCACETSVVHEEGLTDEGGWIFFRCLICGEMWDDAILARRRGIPLPGRVELGSMWGRGRG